KPPQALPREGEFDSPPAIAIGVVVHCPVHRNGSLFAGVCPVELTEAPATGVMSEADPIEGLQFRARKLGGVGKTLLLVGVLPDEEDFVASVEAVNLEFVIGVTPGDEELDVVIVVDGIVVIGVFGVQQGFLNTITDVEVLIVPKHRGSSAVEGTLA